MLREATILKNYHLGALDGEIGRVKEFYFDDHTWTIRYLVADTGKWLPHRKVLISPHALGGVDDEENLVHVQLTRDQVEKSPSIDSDKPVSRQFEEEYLRYFGWPFYWTDPLVWGAPTNVSASLEEGVSAAHRDTHLRSMSEVVGYHIQAFDGEVGHVEDFLIDDSEWTIRELIVDTRNWLPGKRVSITPDWVSKVTWEESKVYVNLDSASLKELPEFHSDTDKNRLRRKILKAYDKEPLPIP